MMEGKPHEGKLELSLAPALEQLARGLKTQATRQKKDPYSRSQAPGGLLVGLQAHSGS